LHIELTIIVLFIILVSTLVRVVFGFGNALIAMPLLALVIGVRVATPLIALVGALVALAMLVTEWRSVQLGDTWRLTLSSLVGIPIGLWFLKGSHEALVKGVLAVLTIGFSSYNLLKPRLITLRDDRLSYGVGFIAGILGGAYNTNGPPIIIFGTLRGWSAADLRATLQGYFLLTGVIILVSHRLAGLWTPEVLHLFTLSLIPIALTQLFGRRLSRAIPEKRYDRYINLFLLVTGLALLAQVISRG